MKQATQTQSYVSKEIAAQRLGLSIRRVLELSDQGQITRSKLMNHETGRRQVALLESDVDRLYTQRQGVAVLPPQSATENKAPATAALLSQPWITLEDAETYTGLPASFLQSLIDEGTLPACNVGVRPGGRWRVKKGDLDAIEGTRATLDRG